MNQNSETKAGTTDIKVLSIIISVLLSAILYGVGITLSFRMISAPSNIESFIGLMLGLALNVAVLYGFYKLIFYIIKKTNE